MIIGDFVCLGETVKTVKKNFIKRGNTQIKYSVFIDLDRVNRV